MILKRLRNLLWLGLLELASFSVIFASETEAGHDGSAWLDIAGKTVNFLILFGGLSYLLYRPLKRWLSNKTQNIASNIEETGRERKEAEQQLASIKMRLTKIGQEMDDIKRKAEAEGLREKERILALAREEAGRIEKLTNLEIEALRKGAVRELKAYAASLATALAETRIKQKLTPELHRHLIRRSIERLAKLNESPSSG